MGDALKVCPECGAHTDDTEWCDECGAALSSEPTFDAVSEFELLADDGRVKAIVVEVLEAYSGRRTLLCEIEQSDADSIAVGETVVVEERSLDEARPYSIPDEVSHLFRQPFAMVQTEDFIAHAYQDSSGLSLADLVSVANGRLSFRQIVDVFLSVCGSVEQAHDKGYLVLALSPWTVRVDGGDLESRARRVEKTSEIQQPTSPVEVEPSEIEELFAEGEEDDSSVGYSLSEATDQVMSSTATTFDDITAMFEGIDFLVGINDEPEEVPVIMGFSAPEFFGPYAREIAPSCDVFALGMLLYFLAAGRVPPSSVYSRHAPAFGFRTLRPGFPPGLQPVISKATHPLQSERYKSVDELRSAFLTACEKIDHRVRRAGEPLPRPKLRQAFETHIGITKRLRNPVNQDAVFGGISDDGAFSLSVVADGVSTASYGSGDLASHFLVEEAEKVWDKLLPTYLLDEPIDPVAVIGDLLAAANESIVAYVNEHHTPFSGNPHEVMGSTALVAIYHEGFVTCGSLGDSRAYLFNELGMEQLTVDHNLWTLSIVEGVPPESAMAMPHGDALARCLGTFRIEGGELVSIRPEPDYNRFVVLGGDTLLLTTDGLVDFGGSHPLEAERNIEYTLRAEPIPELVSLEMILLANRGGGGDNIGVGVLKFGGS